MARRVVPKRIEASTGKMAHTAIWGSNAWKIEGIKCLNVEACNLEFAETMERSPE